MKITKTLKEFTRQIITCAGSGYKYSKIVKIPPHKSHRIAQISKKIAEEYKTDLSRGKKQYRRTQGFSNYQAINYKDLIVIFKTAGTDENKAGEFLEYERLILEVSEHISIILHKDERNKYTIRLTRGTYRTFREDFKRAIQKKDAKQYYYLKEKFHNLPKYKGIGKQGKALHRNIQEALKDNGLKWSSLYSKR